MQITCLAFGPFHNGPLISASTDSMVKVSGVSPRTAAPKLLTALQVWNHKTGSCAKTLAGHLGTVNALVVEPNVGLWSGGDDGALMVRLFATRLQRRPCLSQSHSASSQGWKLA